MNSFISRAEQFLSELPIRAQHALVAIGVLIALIGLATLSDMRNEQSNRRADLLSEYNALSGPTGVTDWQERVSGAIQVKQAWEQKRWSAPTTGIASANAQEFLSNLAREVGLESVRHSVSSDPVTIDDNQMLRFELAGIGTPDLFASVLVDLGTSSKTVLITEFSAPIRRNQKSRLYVSGYMPYAQTQKPGGAPE